MSFFAFFPLPALTFSVCNHSTVTSGGAAATLTITEVVTVLRSVESADVKVTNSLCPFPGIGTMPAALV